MYTGNPSRLLNPYCQKYFLLLSECDKTKEMENDPDRCKSPVSTPPRMEHVVWISQQGCSFPFQTASTGASVLSSPSPSVEVGSQPECLKSLSPSSGPFNVTSAFQPKNFDFPKKGYGKQNRSFQQKLFERFPWLRYNEENDSVLCFICAKQKAKKNLISATKKEEAFLKGGFSNWNKRHLINSKNMKLPSAIKRLLTTRSIFRNLVAIFTN